jgi:hypothetical protein
MLVADTAKDGPSWVSRWMRRRSTAMLAPGDPQTRIDDSQLLAVDCHQLNGVSSDRLFLGDDSGHVWLADAGRQADQATQ